VFREQVGLSPKLYCRLARFQAGLCYVVPGGHVEWAQAAVQLGYADQSHMITEFREFSSATPDQLIAERWFHPFIERAKTAAPPR
jgi:methylphosphotriester-DNA--protein-cysteine methyltransferase